VARHAAVRVLAVMLSYLPLPPCCPLLQVEQLFRDCPRVQTVWTPDSSYKCAHLPAVALWL
jgi:hypothetical protein